MTIYQLCACRLHALPYGFPPSADPIEALATHGTAPHDSQEAYIQPVYPGSTAVSFSPSPKFGACMSCICSSYRPLTLSCSPLELSYGSLSALSSARTPPRVKNPTYLDVLCSFGIIGAGFALTKADLFPVEAARGVGQMILVRSYQYARPVQVLSSV